MVGKRRLYRQGLHQYRIPWYITHLPAPFHTAVALLLVDLPPILIPLLKSLPLSKRLQVSEAGQGIGKEMPQGYLVAACLKRLNNVFPVGASTRKPDPPFLSRHYLLLPGLFPDTPDIILGQFLRVIGKESSDIHGSGSQSL